MPALSLSPDNYTFPFLLNSCAVAGDLASGTELHSRLLRTGFAGQVHVANALIDMYGKCSQLPLARRAFEEMNQRDIVSGNALLGAHARLGQDMLLAKKVFDEMPQRNVISWNAMVVGHVNAGDLAAARAVFNEIPQRNFVSWTVMILGYCKNGFVHSARELFDDMPQKNLVSWTAMITGYSQSGQSEEALALFREMRRAGVEADAVVMTGVISAVGQLGSAELAGWVGDYVDQQSIERNERVLTALVDMYAKCGDVERAFRLFEEIPSPDAFSYTALINGLASNGHSLDALKVFDEMLEKEIKPDPITLIGVLTACGHAGLVDEGLRFWHAMREDYGMEPRPDHYACVVDMLGRAGRLEEAYEVLRKMPPPPPPHAGALGAMLAACRTHGNVEIAERVAGELFEVEPENTGNYVLLSSIYAEKGLWAEAAGVRKKMRARAEKLPGASWI
ncbi:Putative pentatricopeptide repeat-containing protein [Apostasia shenzhenica]|uniref:Pentatricopeptide repeat-containing protein n=1 Tax=Apostasia shenzhenica TaxID=1088818 RepID=A0A2I0AZD0_9ASPA|nr:Putative pentatricopeptide repeat-containing protein [Apostasia shenzhenica]